ncbi:hypothetical protein Tco_0206965 [Tanacetum coccineum]
MDPVTLDATLLATQGSQQILVSFSREITRIAIDFLTPRSSTSEKINIMAVQETDSGCWGFRRLYNLLLWLNWVAAASDSFSAAEKIEGNNYTKSLVC